MKVSFDNQSVYIHQIQFLNHLRGQSRSRFEQNVPHQFPRRTRNLFRSKRSKTRGCVQKFPLERKYYSQGEQDKRGWESDKLRMFLSLCLKENHINIMS